MDLLQDASLRAHQLVEWRRALHRHPELGHHEHWTSQFIRDRLTELDIPFEHPIGATGIVAYLARGRRDAPALALRADFDALPIEETNDLPFRSEIPGHAHLCGHDGHTAILLGAAALLKAREEKLPAEVRLIFQHAEEVVPNGASDFVRAGALNGVAQAFALHNHPGISAGVIGVASKHAVASSVQFSVELMGRGGHAALPHLTRDPIVAAAALIQALQSVVSRRVSPLEPAVVSIARIRGGEVYNVIPEQVSLLGTARALTHATMEILRETIFDITQGIARAHDVTAAFSWIPATPPLINDPDAAAAVHRAVESLGVPHISSRNAEPEMFAEDFAFMAEVVPSCYFFLGCRDEQNQIGAPLHSPLFRFNEEMLPVGAALMARLALQPREAA